MQGVNPAWFERAMEGIGFGIHRVEKYGELVVDSAELFRKSFEQMEKHHVRYGLLSHGSYKEAFMDARPEMFLLSYEPDLSLEDHTEAALEFERNIINGRYAALGELGLIYAGIPLNAPDLYPYYEVAQRHGIPVFIHTGFSGPNPQQVLSPAFRIGTANPLLLEDVIIDFPDLKIVMMQMAWPEVIGRSVTTIREAEYLSFDDKRAILWENASALFEIEEMQEKPPPTTNQKTNEKYRSLSFTMHDRAIIICARTIAHYRYAHARHVGACPGSAPACDVHTNAISDLGSEPPLR